MDRGERKLRLDREVMGDHNSVARAEFGACCACALSIGQLKASGKIISMK